MPQRSESSDAEKQETAQTNELAGTKIQSEDDAHVTGVKLLVLLIGLGLVTFLMALDVSVIATVCQPCASLQQLRFETRSL